MENGPEITSQAPTTASSTDEVMVSDVPAPENVSNDAVAVAVDAETPLDETSVPDVSSTETVFSADETVDVVAAQAVEPEAVPDTEAPDLQEAPVPQPVQMFDLGDDLGVHPEAPTFDMAEETVEPTVSDEVVDEPVDNAESDDDEAEATIAVETTASALRYDEEIFEQVMGSSRVEDIPVPRRSRPGSIPLPPQVAEEQIRRQRSAAPASAASIPARSSASGTKWANIPKIGAAYCSTGCGCDLSEVSADHEYTLHVLYEVRHRLPFWICSQPDWT